MAKKLKILLVEDDKRFGDSLKRLLDKEDFECVLAEKPQTALSFCKLHNFDIAIVDCMLPQMNGVELALKIKEFFGPAITLYMMSGIYKDRNFTVSTLKKTGAKSFLIKPFDLNGLIQEIKETKKDVIDEHVASDNPLKNLYFQQNLSQNVVSTTFESLKLVNGHELSTIFNLLLTFKCAGRMTLKLEKMEYPVHFTEHGLSVQPVNLIGPGLKTVLMNKAYVSQEDLLNFKIEDFNIQRLVSQNYLSPHFGELILKEVAFQALTSFTINAPLQFSFKTEKVPPLDLTIEPKELDELIHSWVMTSDLQWLKTHYLPYKQFTIKKMPTSQNKMQYFPLVNGNKNLYAFMTQNKSLEEILSQSSTEDLTMRLLHLLIIYRDFYIGTKSNAASYSIQTERLKKIFSTMDNQTAFERLGLKETASDQEIKRVYTEMSQTLHPDKLKDAPQELIVISTKVYDKIQDAYNSIKTIEKRNEYLKRMEQNRIEKTSRAQRLLDEAINHLIRGDFSSAEVPVQTALELAPYVARNKIIQTWLLLKLKKITAQDGIKNIQSIPNEDRDTALYLHVRGLCHLSLNEFDKAQQSFKNALVKDNNFMASRRELSSLNKDEKKQNVGILNSDLRDVVGLFFNKKNKK